MILETTESGALLGWYPFVGKSAFLLPRYHRWHLGKHPIQKLRPPMWLVMWQFFLLMGLIECGYEVLSKDKLRYLQWVKRTCDIFQASALKPPLDSVLVVFVILLKSGEAGPLTYQMRFEKYWLLPLQTTTPPQGAQPVVLKRLTTLWVSTLLSSPFLSEPHKPRAPGCLYNWCISPSRALHLTGNKERVKPFQVSWYMLKRDEDTDLDSERDP